MDEKKGRPREEGMENDQNKAEEERRKKAMKERENKEFGILHGDIKREFGSDCELDEWKMEDQQPEVQKDGPKDTEHFGQDGSETDRPFDACCKGNRSHVEFLCYVKWRASRGSEKLVRWRSEL